MAEVGVYDNQVERRHDVALPEVFGGAEFSILEDSSFPLIVEMAEVFGALFLVRWIGDGVAAQFVPSIAGCL